MVSTLDGEPGRVVQPASFSRNRKRPSAYVVLTHNGREVWDAAEIILPEAAPQNAAILNPRVMAAAADLFAACQAVEALWRKHGLGDDEDESEPVWNLLRRAIAKAEGRSQ